jgi:hypothetical protein
MWFSAALAFLAAPDPLPRFTGVSRWFGQKSGALCPNEPESRAGRLPRYSQANAAPNESVPGGRDGYPPRWPPTSIATDSNGVREETNMRETPGFAAEASVYRSPRQYPARGPDQAEAAIVPAQFHSLNWRSRPWLAEPDFCPPGERAVYVPEKRVPKYCTGKRWTYDLAQMAWIQVEFTYNCGWEFAPAHWECQLPTFQVLS